MVRSLVRRNRGGEATGFYSVCSANPWVIEAAMRHAAPGGGLLAIESTSNQVNQFGGYTGQTPQQFAEFVAALAARTGFPAERILLGGDHLGPYPWRKEPAAAALGKAVEMVREYVQAGYAKVHLDASMRCGDDPEGPLAERTIAERSALLCRAAEEASGPGGGPVYVVGTEVPVPGGEQAEGAAPAVTRREDAERTLAGARAAFHAQGLERAWERVIGLVVQPGVEFGDAVIFGYDRAKARPLSISLPADPELVYEAHSTDYQTPRALREMVEDHFAILKVGPWLTFAFREAVFALAAIEQDWLAGRSGIRLSRVRETLEEAMLSHPEHWQPYYRGGEADLRVARVYSYSDRSRYYWPDARVQAQLNVLLANLVAWPPPLTLLSQYLPAEYGAVRAGALANEPAALIDSRIRAVLDSYAAACRA
ncbi:MAG TPA: class II D-tagatose-bisphosphate aldolase, non-catalytic subunit [Bryobacteraceae bacterium]|nr:class II D-tagatose-bisphosphate aldolase, non-catalytic subunit [Bryobacteraceae bacterium]